MSDKLEKINKWFASLTPHIIRMRWFIIVAIFVATVVMAVGISRLQLETSNDSLLLENDPLRLAKHEFEEIFGNDEFVVVLLEADDVFSHAALVANRALGNALLREIPLADDIFSLTDLEFTRGTEAGIEIDDLVPDPIPQDPYSLDEIRQSALSNSNLVDRLFSKDSRSTIIALELKPYPKAEETLDLEYQIKITEKLRAIISRHEYADFKLTMGGTPVLMEGEMRWASAEMENIMGTTMLLMMILLAVFFRSVVAVIAPLLTATISMFVVLGFYGWAGIAVQELMLIIPLLLALVLSIGYNVHVLSFFRQKFLVSGSRQLAITHAMEQAAWPILFTAITTAIGLLSFVLVPIVSIRTVGLTSAGLLLLCYPLVVLLTPALLSFGKDRKPGKAIQKKHRIENALEKLSGFVASKKIIIIVIYVAVTALFAFFIPSIEVNTDYTRTFGEKVPYIADGLHISRSIGSLYSYELSVDFGKMDALKIPENLKAMEQLEQELRHFETYKRSNSVIDIIKDLNKVLNEGDISRYQIPDDPALLSQLFLLYEMSGGTETANWIDYEYQRARIQVELGSFTSQDIEAQVNFIQNRSRELFPEGEVLISGIAPVFAKVANFIVSGQILSIILALMVIAGVMMIVFGNVRLGLIGMIPNITPVVISLGVMALLDTPLHMMTMMVAPMIIGIAVDDTIHFINHYRYEYHLTGSYIQANRLTFRTVGKAVLLTSAIICLGFAAFLPSQLLAYHHVGLYTIIAVLSAMLADYFVTPAVIMLTKPFGKEKHLDLPTRDTHVGSDSI